jgi:hypothetical protein
LSPTHDIDLLDLKELANGGDWGGVKVDQAFDKFLLDIVGMETMDRFRNEDKADYLSLCSFSIYILQYAIYTNQPHNYVIIRWNNFYNYKEV